ncbi:MAG: alpha/beta hydrolase-fold protein [Saprospiraceae bacterium]
MNIIQRLFSPTSSSKSGSWKKEEIVDFTSEALGLSFTIQLFLPPDYRTIRQPLPLLFFNDGQDMEAIRLEHTLQQLYHKNKIRPFIVVAIPAIDRMHTYGTSEVLDYQRRGSRAKAYGQFIAKELLPWLQLQFKVSQQVRAHGFAGFSLGGLSALDIMWHYPTIFGQVGVFSGSLWWRSKAFDPNDPDGNRIMHELMAKGPKKEGLRFWFQAGTADETDDRNNNGVIDAIDDTLDLIKVLRGLGYDEMEYVEVEGGRHEPETWGRVLPQFLRWGFGV